MRLFAILVPLVLGTAAHAQPTDAGQPSTPRPASARPEGWSITVGLAPVVGPAWQGSREPVLSIFPDLRVNYGDTFFASVPDGIGWNAVNGNGLAAGPVVKLRFGRDEDGKGSLFTVAGGSDALVGLGDVNAAVELGGFAEHSFGPRQQWRGRLEVRQGVGGHEGIVGDASLSYRIRRGNMIASIGPRATLATRNFTATYFGIDAAQSLRSGLPEYQPNGGLVSYGLGGSLVRPLGRQSAVTVFASLERLGGVAGDSPLVRERGRREQASLGVGYGFRFGL